MFFSLFVDELQNLPSLLFFIFIFYFFSFSLLAQDRNEIFIGWNEREVFSNINGYVDDGGARNMIDFNDVVADFGRNKSEQKFFRC